MATSSSGALIPCRPWQIPLIRQRMSLHRPPPAAHSLPLMLSLMNCVASSTALQCLKHGSLHMTPSEQDALHALPAALIAHGKQQVAALRKSADKIAAYLPARPLEGRILWQAGATRLLDYGHTAARPPLLLIPSLINRAYILDLDPGRSVIRALAQTASPLLLDWGEPGCDEKNFDTEDYVRQRVLPVLDVITRSTGTRVHVMGYCMGGVLALGAATLAPAQVASLGLFATPWDFATVDRNVPTLSAPLVDALEARINAMESFPAAWVQALFYLHHADSILQKYTRFAAMDADDPATAEFLALEQWAGDGVALTRGVARDCFIAWVHRNRLCAGGWIARPEALSHPTFIAAPRQDRVVPSGSAKALHLRMPHAVLVEPESGHVGMMIGRRAKNECLVPYAAFLAQHPPERYS